MSETEHAYPIDRREAIRRVSALLGGIALVGGSTLVTACEQAQRGAAAAPGGAGGGGGFSPPGNALFHGGGGAVLPRTKNPGGKAPPGGPVHGLVCARPPRKRRTGTL